MESSVYVESDFHFFTHFDLKIIVEKLIVEWAFFSFINQTKNKLYLFLLAGKLDENSQWTELRITDWTREISTAGLLRWCTLWDARIQKCWGTQAIAIISGFMTWNNHYTEWLFHIISQLWYIYRNWKMENHTQLGHGS